MRMQHQRQRIAEETKLDRDRGRPASHTEKAHWRSKIPRLEIHSINEPIDLHPQDVYPTVINDAASVRRVRIVIPVGNIRHLQDPQYKIEWSFRVLL